MGEYESNIFTIGSPDLDIMNSKDLPTLEFVKDYYQINFDKYAILMLHPVTTEIYKLKEQVKLLVDCLIDSSLNCIVIYPNNDIGSDFILEEYKRFENNPKFRIFPSLRFEYFLVILKNAQFTIGNSSAGVREAPYYNIPKLVGSFLLFYNIVPNGGYSMRYQGSADLIAGNNLSLFYRNRFSDK